MKYEGRFKRVSNELTCSCGRWISKTAGYSEYDNDYYRDWFRRIGNKNCFFFTVWSKSKTNKTMPFECSVCFDICGINSPIKKENRNNELFQTEEDMIKVINDEKDEEDFKMKRVPKIEYNYKPTLDKFPSKYIVTCGQAYHSKHTTIEQAMLHAINQCKKEGSTKIIFDIGVISELLADFTTQLKTIEYLQDNYDPR